MKTKVEILEKYFGVANTPINNKAPLETQLQLVTQAALLAMQEYAELFASQFKQSSPEGEGTVTVDDLRAAYMAGYRRMGWEEGVTWGTSPKDKEEPQFDEWLSCRPSPPKSEQPQEGRP